MVNFVRFERRGPYFRAWSGGWKSKPNINFGTLGQFDVGDSPTCEGIVAHDQGVGRVGSSRGCQGRLHS